MKLLKLSIIIPSFNEAEHICSTLMQLQGARKRGHEIILSDGGSTDDTIKLASKLIDHCIQPGKGRALQMNTAARHASGDVLCFLHADTYAPDNIDQLISNALNHSRKIWGHFHISLSGSKWPFRCIEFMMNIRSYLSGVATGDQGIFICRPVFNKLSGFAEIPLMEDIEISKRLRKISNPVCIRSSRLITSSRRWEQNGIVKTVILMWFLRLAYFLGTPASALASHYKSNDPAK